ncbi:hypothetical protein [Paracoccus subflavus]|uniref:hypothetical protein n=1 Tax=Paracoccus subflavus TaxID=2528244 RepID=UPI0013EF2F1B|nr:hypothetical protein [Paracoccus subflavus]
MPHTSTPFQITDACMKTVIILVITGLFKEIAQAVAQPPQGPGNLATSGRHRQRTA